MPSTKGQVKIVEMKTKMVSYTSSEKWSPVALLIASALDQRERERVDIGNKTNTTKFDNGMGNITLQLKTKERYIHVSSFTVSYNDANIATLKLGENS